MDADGGQRFNRFAGQHGYYRGRWALTKNVSNALSGTVALTVNGGAATLSQANNYTGTTMVNGGTLNLNFAASAPPPAISSTTRPTCLR